LKPHPLRRSPSDRPPLLKGEGVNIPEVLGFAPLSLWERGLGVREKTIFLNCLIINY